MLFNDVDDPRLLGNERGFLRQVWLQASGIGDGTLLRQGLTAGQNKQRQTVKNSKGDGGSQQAGPPGSDQPRHVSSMAAQY